MRVYKAKFYKKNGEAREMSFVRLHDLSGVFLRENTKGTGKKAKLDGNRELVFDLEARGFRVFNWDTMVGDPVVEDREENSLKAAEEEK
jgi:hypothetical protein